MVDALNFHISCFDNLNSDTARKLAEPQVEFIRNFVQQLENEVSQK